MSSQMASLVDFTVSLVLERIGLWYLYASFLGAVSGGVVNCTLNYRWVFHTKGRKKKYVAVRYFIVWAVSIALNTYGTYIVTETTGIDFIISKAIVAIIVAIFWNYQMQRMFVFKSKQIDELTCEQEETQIIE